LASSPSVGIPLVFLSGLGAASVVRTAYSVPAGSSTFFKEAAHVAERLAETPRGAEQVRVRRRQLDRPHLPDVMNVDSHAFAGHKLFELRCDGGSVPIRLANDPHRVGASYRRSRGGLLTIIAN
jgi:hypothetical protein